jgi:hypothetical protein
MFSWRPCCVSYCVPCLAMPMWQGALEPFASWPETAHRTSSFSTPEVRGQDPNEDRPLNATQCHAHVEHSLTHPAHSIKGAHSLIRAAL